jgi:4-diphosphocytidyl-2-C-methyl-D-erythritol kinase
LLEANGEHLARQDVLPICPQLGADVAVCMDQRVAVMWGVGEKVSALGPLPETPVVLVNPGVALSTPDVFHALDAGQYDGADREFPDDSPPPFDTVEALGSYLESRGNDLEKAAVGLAPVVGDVKALLSAQAGCLIARMSGSGATCFGIFESAALARQAADRIGSAHPQWWVVASKLA